MRRTPAQVEDQIVKAHTGGTGTKQIAARFGMPLRTVQHVIARHQDLLETTKDLKGDYFTAGFKFAWLHALDRLREDSALSTQDVKNLALSMAISIDKVALIQGWPTQVVAHLHEHRHEVGDIADKLAEVARRLGPAV